MCGRRPAYKECILSHQVLATNAWQLPPNPRSTEKQRKKYIPNDTPDGEFITKIVAEGAGDNGEFTAKTSVTVIVEGGIYDDVGSRITQ